MTTFADTLKTLPSVAHLAGLQLLDLVSGEAVATIENRPGQAGSLAVYAALAQRHGGRIDTAAAAEGLLWYCEHTDDARQHPGKHPNIDRLFECAAGKAGFAVKLLPAR
ncbi:MAG: hypothetical protein RIQ60_2342 [Pseudomonadota bacterium]|jgi:hypothetical protein